jgi:ADP-ribose pyrophosphatase YjhB (NUDIX family)
MNDDYEVLAQGFDQVDILDYDPTIWSPEEIIERDSESYGIERPADPDVEAEILEKVEEAKISSEDSGAEFYNGPLVRVRDFEADNGILGLRLQNTNYFSHSGTRERPELGKENRADPLSVGALLTTSDGRVVLGEKSGLVEYGEGEYQLPGAGFVEEIEGSLDSEPEDSIYRELNEEVNLNSEDLESIEPEALIGAVHRQPMLVYNAETGLESEEVAERWRWIDEADREFSELIFLPEDIDAVLEGESDVLVADADFTEERSFSGELRPHAEGAFQL